MGAIFIMGLVVFAIGVAPILAIWSLNTLFGLGIAYTLKTWAAAFVLMLCVGGKKFELNKSN